MTNRDHLRPLLSAGRGTAKLVAVLLASVTILTDAAPASAFSEAPETPAFTLGTAHTIGLARVESQTPVRRDDGEACGQVVVARIVEALRASHRKVRFFTRYPVTGAKEVLDFLVVVSPIPSDIEAEIRDAPFDDDVIESLECRLLAHGAPSQVFDHLMIPRLEAGLVRTDSNLLSMPGFSDLPVSDEVEGWGPVVGWPLVRDRIEAFLDSPPRSEGRDGSLHP